MPLRKQPFRNRFFSSTNSVVILLFIALMVELYGLFGFFLFSKQKGQEVSKNKYAFTGIAPCNKEEAMFSGIFAIPCTVYSDFHIIKVTEGFNRSRISHFNSQGKCIGGTFTRVSWGSSFNSDATFTINKASKICFVHPDMQDTTNRIKLQEFFSAKLPNSVDTLPSKAEGNTEPSRTKVQACVTTKGQPRKG